MRTRQEWIDQLARLKTSLKTETDAGHRKWLRHQIRVFSKTMLRRGIPTT